MHDEDEVTARMIGRSNLTPFERDMFVRALDKIRALPERKAV